MKIKRSLRIKLTLVTVLIMTIMCVLLTVVSQRAGQGIISAIDIVSPVTPAEPSDIQYEMEMHNIGTAMISTPAQLVRAQNTFNLTTLGSMILIVLLGGALVFIFVKHELSPLEKLSEQVQTIDADNLSAPITISNTGNEIEQLSLAIADMAARVNDAYIMQKSFSGAAAHELRTPLAAIQAKIEVFKLKSNRTKEEYSQLINTVSSNVARLSDLVQQLLQLTSQADSDLTQQLNLRTIAEEAALDLQPLAAQNNIEIIIEGEGEIKGNDCLMQRAIFNLMQNAVRYNTKNGKVYVTIKPENGKTVIEVADTGIGIENEHRDKIFDLFYCADKSRSRELGGNGLGLAIVKQIITSHKGTVSVRQNSPSGTVFEIIL